MIVYPMTNRDAMRSVMVRVPAAQVKFIDPTLNMFFDDETLGLCVIEIKRLRPEEIVDAHIDGRVVQHQVHVTYHDAKLEFVKRLSI
jgi:hypothetical protein